MSEDPLRDVENEQPTEGERADAPKADSPTSDAPAADAPVSGAATSGPPSQGSGASASSLAAHGPMEPCPKCGAPTPEAALVCVKCGWDFARNEPTRTRASEIEVDESAAPAKERAAISQSSKLGWKPLLIAGGVAFAVAAILAGGQAAAAAQSDSAVRWIVGFFDVLINGLIRTGLGLAALLFVARVLEAPFGKIGLAAARMTLAVGLFYLAFYAAHALGLATWVEWILGAGAGAAAYYLVIMWVFALERDAVLLVGGAHFILWLAAKTAVWLDLAVHANFS